MDFKTSTQLARQFRLSPLTVRRALKNVPYKSSTSTLNGGRTKKLYDYDLAQPILKRIAGRRRAPGSKVSPHVEEIRMKGKTLPERILWRHIRNKQLGVIFRWRVQVDDHIPSFYCRVLRLVIDFHSEKFPRKFENMMKDS